MQALLIEDDVPTAKSIQCMLQSLGHHCDWVEQGEDGMTLAKTHDYDVILLDIMLPGIDGYEVLQQLRAADIETPVILQSGIVERERDIEGLGLGVTDYLLKPYSKEEISVRVNAAVESARLKAMTSNDELQPGKSASERRSDSRSAMIKSGQIVYRAATCVMDCVILNLSDEGAALQPEDPHRLPATFNLAIHHGPTYHCEVCWRHRNKLGVRFLDS
ncbi:MAG: response regulator [Gammaproteobacteria bacterium]